MMSSFWVNFVAMGDPNGRDSGGKALPHWPAVSGKPDTTIQVGDGTGAIPLAGSPAKIDFWMQYLARPKTPAVSSVSRQWRGVVGWRPLLVHLNQRSL